VDSAYMHRHAKHGFGLYVRVIEDMGKELRSWRASRNGVTRVGGTLFSNANIVFESFELTNVLHTSIHFSSRSMPW
jgi:hypothetical protein